MTSLRTLLRWQALLWSLSGVALLAVPGTILEGIFEWANVGHAVWLRALGVAAVVLAAQMVLVGRRLEDLWWWCWSFVVLEVGTALAFATHALFGLGPGEPRAPWWGLAVLNAAIGGVQVWALARAGMERSPV